jgi:predicted Zn finger-like uncharacterized protein
MMSKFFFLSILSVLSSKSTSVLAFTTTTTSLPRHAAPSSSSTSLNADVQAEYGKSLEMPQTYATCGQCGSSYALTEDDLGSGKGRRLECSVCGHAWFQSRNRLMTLGDSFEMVELPPHDLERIERNIAEGKSPKYVGAYKMYVGNIAFQSTEEDLRELFEEMGDVGDVSLVRDDQGRNRGFGFVTMREKEGAA